MTWPRIDFESSLNEQQLAAVTHEGGSQLVIAGAGSGKTRVITYRIAWLISRKNVHPRAITAVTFTNKAAGEMRERTAELLESDQLGTFVGTFHRLALRLLRIYGDKVGIRRDFTILDGSDQRNLIRKAMLKEGLSEESFRPQSVAASISAAKNKLQTPLEYEQQELDFYRRRIAPVYRRYQKLLRESTAIDFDDMIRLAVVLLRDHLEIRKRVQRSCAHLLVDEFQDTNHAQLSLVRYLSGDQGLVTAVGDEDQGIYRWRGAELENILSFEEHFPGAHLRKLERNYRSTQNILDASGAVVANNTQRRGKRLWTDAGGGHHVTLFRGRDEQDEARWVIGQLDQLRSQYSLADMAVLVRTNAQTRALEEQCHRKRMNYTLIGGQRFYERVEIKDLVAYLRLARNPTEPLAFERILNKPPRGIGNTTRKALFETADATGTSPWELLVSNQLAGIPNRGRKALERFRDLASELVEAANSQSLSGLLTTILDRTAYQDLYSADTSEDRARLENIDEFLSAAEDFSREHQTNPGRNSADRSSSEAESDELTAFLDHASLSGDLDGLDRQGGLSIMTLHSAKGLEFPVVVVAGLEEDLLPHFNSKENPADIEEERRLLYVGMTRARRRLLLTSCARRRVAGRYQDRDASRFLLEIPEKLLITEESPQLFPGRPASSDVYSFFSGGARPARSGASRPPRRPPKAAAQSAAVSHQSFSSESSPAPRGGGLRRGRRVVHPTLGNGRILKTEGSGDDMRLSVFFDGHGKRKLIAKFARLELL